MVLDLAIHLLIAIGAAFVTQKIGGLPTMNAVKSSSLLTLVFCLILVLLGHQYEVAEAYWSALFFGATFVGMTGALHLKNFGLAMAASVYGLLFYFTNSFYNGIGGALGVSACFSVIFILILKGFFNKIRSNHGQ